MEEKEVKQTLNDIRSMMSKSSRFQSISGYSIILVGLLAAVATMMSAVVLGVENSFPSSEKMQQYAIMDTTTRTRYVALIGIVLFILSMATMFVFAVIKSKKNNLRFVLDKRTCQMLLDFFIPLIAGGVLSFAMIMQHHYGLTSSIMLIFYGLALINCSHYTYPILRYLGYAELLLGFIDCFMISHALLCWFLGFSVLHIIFGIIYVILFDRKKA